MLGATPRQPTNLEEEQRPLLSRVEQLALFGVSVGVSPEDLAFRPGAHDPGVSRAAIEQALSALRERGLRFEAIMITAANDLDTVQHALYEGVLDYLIKPFQVGSPGTELEFAL